MSSSADGLWKSCKGHKFISPLSGTLYHLVESQEQFATRQLADMLEEQALLAENTISLPFLKMGSRFGRTFEPSIFYGGCSVEVTLAESAYYGFVFWHSMDGKVPKSILRSAHTLFSVGYQSAQGIRLQSPPFDHHVNVITDPTN